MKTKQTQQTKHRKISTKYKIKQKKQLIKKLTQQMINKEKRLNIYQTHQID